MKIGILGGSFDPIHNGHLHMASKALEEYRLDEIWLIPAAHSPNKDETGMTAAYHRLKMCELAAEGYENFFASDYEMKYEGTSYTCVTLLRLTEDYPDNEFYFIMGADSLDYFEKWRNPEIIASLCTILVIVREGFSQEEMSSKINALSKLFACNIRLVHCDRYDISSTEIRQKIKANDDCSNIIPSSVLEYIKENNLYGSVK